MVMIWCYMAHMIVIDKINWRNQCVQHVIQFEKVWETGCQGLGNTEGLKNQDAIEIT